MGYLHFPRVAWPPAVCTLPGGWFGRAESRGIIAACFLLLVTVVGKDGVIVGCLQQYQITMGCRPCNKSSGMAARTP